MAKKKTKTSNNDSAQNTNTQLEYLSGVTGISLDQIDLKIAHELVNDGSQSSRQIADKLHIPHTTVYRRVQRLLKHDILHIVALPNPKVLGYDVWVLIGVDTKHGFARTVAQSLLRFPFFYVIVESLGPHDVIAAARFRTINDLTDFVCNKLTDIDGIERSTVHHLVRPHRFYDYSWMIHG